MYLQSAEISNFRGIRHLKISFERDTTALIGENAWGKSSLLAALWMLLGQSDSKLCRFSKDDLYIPIKVEEDLYSEHEVPSSPTLATKTTTSTSSVQEQLSHLKPYKVVTTKDIQRCYYSIPNPHGSGSILKIVDEPLQDKHLLKEDQNPHRHFKYMHSKHKFTPKLEQPGKNTKTRNKKSSYEKLNAQNLIAEEQTTPCNKYKNYPGRFYNYALENFIGISKNIPPLQLSKKDQTSSVTLQPQTPPEVFAAMQAAVQAEAHYEKSHPQDKEDNFLRLQRAKDLLSEETTLDETGRQLAHEDYDFFSKDIYSEKASSIVIDLIFCESLQDSIHHIERFAQLRSVAYEDPEDSLFKIHYRITGHFVKNHSDSQKEDEFVTDHELLNSKGEPIPASAAIIDDLRILNPLLRLRDRRMFKTISSSYLGKDGDSPAVKAEISYINSFFNQISDTEDLNCHQLNQGLEALNFIAGKYLMNYQSQINTPSTTSTRNSRTARDIISQPVSIETLHSLRASLEDKKPSRSKFLLSLLTGALLMSNQQRKLDEHAKPILILEDVEGRFHPTLLLTLWSILQTIPIQKIITTNSSELLSVMPLHNIRRLCRQYYNVRCYQLADRALSTEDARRIAFHIRMSRPSSLFARCWILVEGETEVWMLNEIAGILGLNLACEGVKLVEFAQCGLSPLIKLAMQLGISYYVLTDGDDAGRRYAQTVQNFSGKSISDHLSVIPHLDIEHYLYVSGYADVYQKAAGLELQIRSQRRKFSREAALNILRKDAALGEASLDQAPATSHKLQQLLPLDASRNDKASLIRLLHQLLHEIKMQPQDSLPPQLIKAACATRATLNAHAAAHLDNLDPEEACKLDKSLKEARNAVTKPETPTFDLSRISQTNVDAFYKKAITSLQNPHSQKTPSHRQRQAIERLYHERNSVLLNLGLIESLPDEELRNIHKAKLSLRTFGDYQLPPALYNFLKHNYYQKQELRRKKKNKKAKDLRRQQLLNEENSSKKTAIVSAEAVELLEAVLKELTKEYKLSKNIPLPELPLQHNARKHTKKKLYGDNDMNKAYGALDKNALSRQGLSMDKVIDIAIHKKSKPGLAIMVVEAMQQRGKDAVPQMFQNMFMKIKRIAKNEFAI